MIPHQHHQFLTSQYGPTISSTKSGRRRLRLRMPTFLKKSPVFCEGGRILGWMRSELGKWLRCLLGPYHRANSTRFEPKMPRPAPAPHPRKRRGTSACKALEKSRGRLLEIESTLIARQRLELANLPHPSITLDFPGQQAKLLRIAKQRRVSCRSGLSWTPKMILTCFGDSQRQQVLLQEIHHNLEILHQTLPPPTTRRPREMTNTDVPFVKNSSPETRELRAPEIGLLLTLRAHCSTRLHQKQIP